jgi:Uma2 family endonuclease
MTPIVETRLYTAEEFFDIHDGLRTELVRGVIVVREGPQKPHACTCAQLTGALIVYLDAHPIGIAFAETTYVTERGPDSVRVPDISVVLRDNLVLDPARRYERRVADLAIEIISPTNREREAMRKTAEYLAAGARLVWNASPERRNVTVHAPDAVPYVVGMGEMLDGGDVLPGFRVPVAKIFGWPA